MAKRNFLSLLAVENIDETVPDTTDATVVDDGGIPDAGDDVVDAGDGAPVDMAPAIPAEDAAALADSPEVEIEQQVIAEGDAYSAAADDIPEALEDQEYAGNLGEAMQAQVDANEVGPDAFGTATSAESIARLCKKYDLKHRITLSRESFATPATRRSANLALVKLAKEAESGIMDKIKNALKAIVAWLKNLWTQLTDKNARLKNKALALRKAAVGAKLGGGEVLETKVLGGKDLGKFVQGAATTALSMLNAAKTAKPGVDVTIDNQIADFGYEVSVTTGGEDGASWAVEITDQIQPEVTKSLNTGQITRGCDLIIKALDSYAAGLKEVDRAVNDNSIKSVLSDAGQNAERAGAATHDAEDGKIVGTAKSAAAGASSATREVYSRLMAIQKLTSAANKLFYRSVTDALRGAEASMHAGVKGKAARDDARSAVKGAKAASAAAAA